MQDIQYKQLLHKLGIKVYSNEFDGFTTDFLRMSDVELGSIEDITLENSNYGKIVFSQAVNLT
ncbi:MAG: hypothetical protein KKE50_00200 [Nanoarchaeota archaeon]|nr:hypothetical protein [Nanoarchaeota archaeon]